MEPPTIIVNTVVSILAIDYLANKLACYVSDDGCYPIIFYSLMEASNFAKLWVPFCKKYGVEVRVSFKYFSQNDNGVHDLTSNFHEEWKEMKVQTNHYHHHHHHFIVITIIENKTITY
jgi:hypothetical protein